MMNGIGGDLFAIVYEAKSKKLYGLNASGWTAQKMSLDYLTSQGLSGKIPDTSIHTVTVPGAVAGWDALHARFGKLPLASDLTPAIDYAAEGVPVAELVSKSWARAGKQLAGQPGFAKTFLISGRAPAPGEVFRNPGLAASLRQVAEHGRDAFYRGPLAKTLLDFLKEQGSLLDAADLAEST
jgi:gamma-glutamyltranspeptidase/glutathione hydrolase